MRLENTFEVPSPIDEAWSLLSDVPRIVPCMPGAELTETVDDDHWKAIIHVKLGPVALRFAADLARDEVDPGARSTRLTAKAREMKGRGNAAAVIHSSLEEVAAGTEVTIVTDLSLTGAVAQYGRGIVADVSDQLVRQFAAALADNLEVSGADYGVATAPTAAAGRQPGPATPTPEESASSAGAVAPRAPVVVKPIGGFGLMLRALSRSFRRLVGLSEQDG